MVSATMISINKRLLLCLLCVTLLHVGGLTLTLPHPRVISDSPSVGVVLVHRDMEMLSVAGSGSREIVAQDSLPEPDVADVVATTVEHRITHELVSLSQNKAEPELVDKEKAVVVKPRPEAVMIADRLAVDRGKSGDEVLPSLSISELKADASAITSAATLMDSGDKYHPRPGMALAPTVDQKAQPRYGYHPPPPYPRLARQRGWQGTVEYEVEVLPSGVVGELVLKTSSGYTSLDKAARNAITRWHFNPATRAGIPVESWVVVPVSFVLDASHKN